MYFQNLEVFETEKFQYLLIHKNGSKSVRKCMEQFNPVFRTYPNPNNNTVKWTVIRDPYERFISGLNYNVNKHNIDPTEINYLEPFNNGTVNLKSRVLGHVNHCISQVSYLINVNIDYYVDIKDLHLFLKMHFGESAWVNKQPNKSPLINKNEVMKYLNFDYYVYNKIKDSNNFWNWTQGKIF
tara:strand:+ start:71 stop:619 length:549 start_codon:yes stop_codon:yes gene_type:complete